MFINLGKIRIFCYSNSNVLKNLKIIDPANENLTQTPDIDVMNLITVEDAMTNFSLGPNGALMVSEDQNCKLFTQFHVYFQFKYCMELLEENFDWLKDQLVKSAANYYIFDCPGQVELYTHHKSMRNILSKLEEIGFRICTVNLIDSHYCSEPHKFISTLLLSLNTMLHLEFPHINVLSKADILKQHKEKLQFNLEFYTEVLDLSFLLDALDNNPFYAKYKKLNEAIVSMVEGYGLVSYQLLDSNNPESLSRLLVMTDKANGFAFGSSDTQNINAMLSCAVGAESSKKKYENDYEPYE